MSSFCHLDAAANADPIASTMGCRPLLNTSAMTAGYMFWMVKGGYLLASVMSQLPAWRFMDPLPILDAVDGWAAADAGDDEEEEEDLIF